MRFRAVARHLGPAPGWFINEKVIGRIPFHMRAEIREVRIENGQVRIRFTSGDEGETTLIVDHLIAGTGFRVALSRLKWLDGELVGAMEKVEDTPVLSRNFESSVPGLYFVGLASANSFGPLTRFACGAEFTAKRLTRHLTQQAA
jgi:thioredoxin reductase